MPVFILTIRCILMKTLVLSMAVTSCGLPVADSKMSLLKHGKNFSMIVRSKQGKRLADHLVELEIISYLNRKTVQLANGVGVRSQDLADYLGISNRSVIKHLKNNELNVRQVRRGGGGEEVWLYDETIALSSGALLIEGIQNIPYNYQPLINFFTNTSMIKKLHKGVAVSTIEIAQALGETPNKQFTARIKFLRDYLGIEQQPASRPHDSLWYKKGIVIEQSPEVNKLSRTFKDPQFLELIRVFFAEPTVKAQLTDGRGISSKEIAVALDLPWDGRKIFSYVNELKDELDIKKVIGPSDKRLWVKNGYDVRKEARITGLLKDFFSRPEIVAKLDNGQGVTSSFIAESIGVELRRITSIVGVLKSEFNLVRFLSPSGQEGIWVRAGIEPIAIRERHKRLQKDREALIEFFNRPKIAQRLTNGTGIVAREIKDTLQLDKSAKAINHLLLTLKDDLSIKPIRIDNGQLWIGKDADTSLAKRQSARPSSLSIRFPSGLTLDEFFAQPAIVERLTDGRGISSAEVIDALGLDPQQKASLGQRLRHSSKYLGIKLYTRRGDRKTLWMREGIEPTPNSRQSRR